MSGEMQMPIVPIDIRGGCPKCDGKGWMRQVLDLEEQIENHCMLPD